MTTYFTADTHFFHERAITFGGRPFASVQEMNEGLVENWNAKVGKKDDVWVIGDFAYRNSKGQIGGIFHRLNGHKRLIIGNHDDREVLNLSWSATPVHREEFKLDGEYIVLDHFPKRDWNRMYHGSYHFYGHCHGNIPDYSRCADVGVDRWAWFPVTFEQIKERISENPRNPDHNVSA